MRTTKRDGRCHIFPVLRGWIRELWAIWFRKFSEVEFKKLRTSEIGYDYQSENEQAVGGFRHPVLCDV
jgi:hypothetical protein